MRHWQLLAVLSCVLPMSAGAQVVHGRVADASGQPIPGVVLLLVDSSSVESARALSSTSGEFRLTAGHAGTFRIRALRIGFRPAMSDPLVLRAGEDVSHDVIIVGIPVALEAVRVSGASACRAFSDHGAATFTVWEQIRAALIAAQVTASSRVVLATTLAYDVAVDPNARRNEKAVWQRASVSHGYAARPWRTLSPDQLHRDGYVAIERDNSVTYYAPGIETLLSPVFAADHCFRLVTDRARRSLIGIAFEPTPERKRGTAEVQGTLWVDRASSALRELEFRYVNLPALQADVAGGTMDFARLRDGTWMISHWEIRMPVVEQVILPGQPPEPRVAQVQRSGGELVLARRGSDTLWAGARVPLRGAVLDSASGSPIPGARIVLVGTNRQAVSDRHGRFAIDDVFPGTYTVHVRTAPLDSLSTVRSEPITLIDSATMIEVRIPSGPQVVESICGRAPSARRGGIVIGSVTAPGTTAAAALVHDVRISAEWRIDPLDASRVRRLETRSASNGRFRLCGLPIDTTVTLRARSDSAATAEPVIVNISPAVRLARLEIPLERVEDLVLRGATFAGVVVADSTGEPIPAAEVAFPELKKSIRTDERGAFQIGGIPTGTHHLVVRRLGYGAADVQLEVTGYETLERRVVLGRAVVLTPLVVSATRENRRMLDFDDNRRLGLGHFLTRAELEKYDGMELRTPLQGTPGLGFASGRLHYFPVGTHAPPPLCPTKDRRCLESQGYHVPDAEEAFQGAPPVACYVQVYVDGLLMNPGEPTRPYDLKEIATERVQGIEFYDGPAQTPARYARAGSRCGVLVIWTRRK